MFVVIFWILLGEPSHQWGICSNSPKPWLGSRLMIHFFWQIPDNQGWSTWFYKWLLYQILNRYSKLFGIRTVSVCMYFSFVITRYYEMIAVKVNAYFKKKSTNSYSSFKTYESAHFNEPYVAAVFNASFVNDGFSNFILGKTITNFVIFFWTIFSFLIAEFGFCEKKISYKLYLVKSGLVRFYCNVF